MTQGVKDGLTEGVEEARESGPETIVEFWFGSDSNDAKTAKLQSSLWWSKKASVDKDIKQRFEPLVKSAAAGHLQDWRKSAVGQLALIILMDQLPRNMYRDTSKSFEFDSIALALCKGGLADGSDGDLRPIERAFFYMPLEHSEQRSDQKKSVALFKALEDAVPSGQRPPFASFTRFAVRHRQIIERFGRFPHRNEILGRTSSAEEIEFLTQPGSSF